MTLRITISTRFQDLLPRMPNDPEALFLSYHHTTVPLYYSTVLQVLSRMPTDPEALFLAGAAAFISSNFDSALSCATMGGAGFEEELFTRRAVEIMEQREVRQR